MKARQQNTMRRMAGAGEGFGADQLLSAQIDLRLIPEFDPSVGQGLGEIDASGNGRRMAELDVLQQIDDRGGVERPWASTAEPRLDMSCRRPR
jgi:hypothetical protein